MNQRISERGQALPFIGLCLMVLMGFGAVGVDMGYVHYQQMRMQTATDAAAVAGAQQLIAHGCPDQTDAQTAGQNDSQIDNFTLQDRTSTSRWTTRRRPRTGPIRASTAP